MELLASCNGEVFALFDAERVTEVFFGNILYDLLIGVLFPMHAIGHRPSLKFFCPVEFNNYGAYLSFMFFVKHAFDLCHFSTVNMPNALLLSVARYSLAFCPEVGHTKKKL